MVALEENDEDDDDNEFVLDVFVLVSPLPLLLAASDASDTPLPSQP